MKLDIELEIGEGFKLIRSADEAAIVVYTFPNNGAPLHPGKLATAAWHINCSNSVKLVIRIADTNELGELHYYEEGTSLTNSLRKMRGFDVSALLNAEQAIKEDREGRFVCFKSQMNSSTGGEKAGGE
jgi:hypothetical protein